MACSHADRRRIFELLQVRVLCFGVFQDGDVGSGSLLACVRRCYVNHNFLNYYRVTTPPTTRQKSDLRKPKPSRSY